MNNKNRSHRRFDNRTVKVFKKDIYFGTQLEKYFFNRWLTLCKSLDYINVTNPRDNGIDNEGEFIEKGKTSGADYIIDLSYGSTNLINMPLEIKWVPTFGKLTLKTGDLKGYIREQAAILFIYTSAKMASLRRPKDYNLERHIDAIESITNTLRWGIMLPNKVKDFLEESKKNKQIQPIFYMGNKPGIILKQNDFGKWFQEERWI